MSWDSEGWKAATAEYHANRGGPAQRTDKLRVINGDGRKAEERLPLERQLSLEDFYCYMAMPNAFIFVPTCEIWPASSVNARIPPIPTGDKEPMKPSAWLARHRPVEQMTWAPGLPNVIKGRVISAGGWIEPTLAADKSTGGAGVKMTFQRVIVYPNGHREIEGVTPKQLPSPSPVSVENNDQLICVEKPSQNSASDDQ